MPTASDLINAARRETERWWIKVVPYSDHDADGHWVDCGVHALPDNMKLKEARWRLGKYRPRGHEIVMATTRNPHVQKGT